MKHCVLMVLNWNGVDWLARCLPSVVAAAEVVGADVWVIDNDSHDNSAEMCETQFPTVRFYQVGTNKVMAGYNDAAADSDHEILILLNNDIIVDRDFAQPLMEAIQMRHNAFAAAPCVRAFPPGDNAPVEMAAERPVWRQGWIHGESQLWEDVSPTRYTLGGAMACQREMFLELGGFDSLFFPGYMEDIDLCWRAWKRGWICLYQPNSTVFHAGGASFGRGEKHWTLVMRNEFLFHWKNITDPAMMSAHILGVLLRLCQALLRGDRPRLRGFGQALSCLPKVLHSRRHAMAGTAFSDAEVMQRFLRYASTPVSLDTARGERPTGYGENASGQGKDA